MGGLLISRKMGGASARLPLSAGLDECRNELAKRMLSLRHVAFIYIYIYI